MEAVRGGEERAKEAGNCWGKEGLAAIRRKEERAREAREIGKNGTRHGTRRWPVACSSKQVSRAD